MSFYAEFERDEWEANGGWRGVEPYTDSLTLLFRDDNEEDELEGEPETRTETPVESEPGLFLVTVKRNRFYRVFDHQEDGSWWLVEQGQREFVERIYVDRSPNRS